MHGDHRTRQGFTHDLKARVAAARLSATRAVNRELIALYWGIGKAIVDKQQTLGWGQSVVEQIARDLRAAFPGAGFLGPQCVGHASAL
ncbi:DUF1016 N-terminal domain-containing protein [Variovorax sp. M-6]|uniref:DUF1016 N-terminal domain-containing protein n=1 Tax=Variovorax sp. M-6 TaxID=3233041 RepID=UPI003F98AC38